MKKILIISLFVLGIILPNIDVKAVSIGGVEVNTVTEGDGLYADENNPGRYIYRGTNPNNYIEFNNELWRIISKEVDGTYKIVKSHAIGKMSFDENSNSDYSAPASLNNYLNGEYYNSFSEEAKKLIVSHDFGIGNVVNDNDSLAKLITNENSKIWNGQIGLLSTSDIINSNNNQIECNTIAKHTRKCNETNWLINLQEKWSWLITPKSKASVWITDDDGFRSYEVGGSMYTDSIEVLPTTYISKNVKFEGFGTLNSNYLITSNTPEEANKDTQKIPSENTEKDSPKIVSIPSTSAYASIIITVLGLLCVIASVIITRKVTKK